MTTQQPTQWKPWHKIVLSVSAGILIAAALIAVLSPDPAPEPKPAAAAPKEQPVSNRPTGQVLAAIRMSLDGKQIDADRAVEEVDGDTHYVAVPLADADAIILVSYKDDAAYLSGMKAVNGAARSNTNLADGPDTITAAGERALAAAK